MNLGNLLSIFDTKSKSQVPKEQIVNPCVNNYPKEAGFVDDCYQKSNENKEGASSSLQSILPLLLALNSKQPPAETKEKNEEKQEQEKKSNSNVLFDLLSKLNK